MADIEAETLARQLSERSPAGIAEQVRELISTGTLTGGMRLPTVRDLATELGVSVGTIAQAWSLLRESNLVETRRRGGTRIMEPGDVGGPSFRSWSGVDLLHCSPDLRLLPSMEEGLLRSLKQPQLHSWSREHILPELQRAVEKKLGSTAEGARPRSFAAISSTTEGLWLATKAVTSPGDLIAVEEPAPPGYLSVPRSLGLRMVPVPVDEHGPVPAALQEALDAGATAFVHSPGGAFSPRHVLSTTRGEDLQQVLASSPKTVVIEEDPLGPLSEVNPFSASLDGWLPERTLRVIGFERAYGMDLRTAVLAGPQELIARVITERSGGVSSNSRVLQHTLAFLLRDPGAGRRITSARTRYATRRRMALEAFALAGLQAHAGPASWAVWIEVPDERAAALTLSAQGVITDVGSSSHLSEQPTGLLRISIAQLPEDQELLSALAQLVLHATEEGLNSTFV
ncbi:aminotransferase class I/II-fold pyridoxal phosphate-dependent enzyme [Nesterenkonia lutea]|uniref:DNA-binding transcriptional MocR family regulator n=1 Tax=Nesterenkonia lutea TaxID=272919 RepID=A0ABR9JAY8_9MICC|nr:PLP-dependent aminotransferase family protein [Nesterenkonia lutea]MBE1523001.1 DNA-binding transcriptional MocR family regulator [Nesterenkonia lutea]